MKQFFTLSSKVILCTLLCFIGLVLPSKAQVVSTLAGTGYAGNSDATGTSASFHNPWGLAVDATGNVYVADQLNHKIRKITPAGVVSTLAGSGSTGSANETGTSATFHTPTAIAVDLSGNLYVADQGNHKIRKVTPEGVVSTFAGTGTSGSINGAGTIATFTSPWGVAVDASGNVYVADHGNHKIRKITSSGEVSTLAGTGSTGSTDGAGASATFNAPAGVAVDANGNVYVAELSNRKIRKITSAGVVSTFAGSGNYLNTDGQGTAASFSDPNAVAVDSYGNLYITDGGGNRVRKITAAGYVSSYAGGNSGSADGSAGAAGFSIPTGVAVDASGNLYIADRDNHKIRKISAVVTGLEEEGSLEPAFYPNPVRNRLYIGSMHQENAYEIMDLEGRSVMTGTIRAEGIDVSRLNSGMFFLKISTGKATLVERLVKE